LGGVVFLPGKRLLQGVLIGLVVFMVIGAYTVLTETPLLQAGPGELDSSIGHVNVREVFEAHPDTMTAEMQLSREAQAMQEEMEEKAADLSEQEQQALIQEYQQRLALREQELISEVVEKIEDIVAEVAQERGIEVVLEAQNVIYGGEDLTAAVLEKIND